MKCELRIPGGPTIKREMRAAAVLCHLHLVTPTVSPLLRYNKKLQIIHHCCINRAEKFFTPKALLLLYNAFIHSHLTHCPSIFGCAKNIK